jgi:HD-like signal output (HDOD) protein
MSGLPLTTVLDMAKTIPCSPAVVPGLLALVQQDDVEIHSVERLIRMDTGLTTAVLRLANSAYFGARRRCEDVDEAMLRLGTRTVYRLAATASAGRWLSHHVQGYGWQPGDLARHSLAVAIAAECLAGKLKLARPETAYTAGLIHDVGKLAMAYANLPALVEVESRAGEGPQSWQTLEREEIGYDSMTVSKMLLQHWGFPSSLVAVGAHYSRPLNAEPEDRPLVVLIHAAKHLALQLGYGVGSDGFYMELDEDALTRQGFTEEILEESLPDVLESITKYIGSDGQIHVV